MNPDGSIVPAEQAKPGAVPLSRPAAVALKELPRRARLAFLAERRKGRTEEQALATAMASLPKGK